MNLNGKKFYFDLVLYRTRMLMPSGQLRRMMGKYSFQESKYFLDKFIAKNREEFEQIDIAHELEHILRKGFKEIRLRLKNKLEEILPFPDLYDRIPAFEKYIDLNFDEYYERAALPSFYFSKKFSSLLIPRSLDSFLVISETKKNVTQLVKKIKSESEKLSDATIKLDSFSVGEKSQELILSNTPNVSRISFEEAKNDFEKEIIRTCKKNTDSLLSNVNVYFKNPIENFECDVYVAFGGEDKLIIEPTDYNQLKRELPSGKLKQELVLQTSDKARRLGAKAVVIAKGFPDQTFSEIKKIADSRGVVLFNEENYKVKIVGEFLEHMLPQPGAVFHPSVMAVGDVVGPINFK